MFTYPARKGGGVFHLTNCPLGAHAPPDDNPVYLPALSLRQVRRDPLVLTSISMETM